jgi:hypothetical protein
MADSGFRPEHDQEPGFFRTLAQDFRRVLPDIRRVGFGRSMSRTLTELQEFYFTTERRDRLAGMGRVKRWLYLSFWLLKSLFLRLTPARRILLLLALVILPVASAFAVGSSSQVSFRLPSIGVGLLLVILMLELKDKLLSHEELQAGRSTRSRPTRSAGTWWTIWRSTRADGASRSATWPARACRQPC